MPRHYYDSPDSTEDVVDWFDNKMAAEGKRKAGEIGGRGPSFEELQAREYGRDMEKQSREVERRFPNGCSVQLSDQRVNIIDVVTAYDRHTRVVRYHVVGIYNGSGSLKVHRMSVPAFLRMVKDAKPG